MWTRNVLMISLLLMLLSVGAFAQTTVIGRYTVVPVTMLNGMNSAYTMPGDTFTAQCATADCGGFPTGTTFAGEVTAVTRRSGRTPGQIEVRFTHAILPTGQRLAINGALVGLDSRSVTTDRNTGRLIARSERRNERNKFIAYGAGAGLVIGALTGNNAIRGTVLGAAAGWLFGALQRGEVRDVDVPAGTRVGLMLTSAVRIPVSGRGPRPGPGPRPDPGDGYGYSLLLTEQQPFTTAGRVLMIPFREVLSGIGQHYEYRSATASIYMQTPRGRAQHRIGTSVVYINDAPIRLDDASRRVNGVLFVPSDFITAINGRSVTWIADRRTLLVR